MEIDLRPFVQKTKKLLSVFGWKPTWWPPYLKKIGLPGALVFLLLVAVGMFAIGARVSAHDETPVATTVEITGQVTATPVAPTDTPTPTPTLAPTPTATTVPVAYVVQSDNVVYLLKEPGLTILASVPVGSEVEIRDAEPVIAGGITWVPVRYDGTDGWLADYQVYPIQAGYALVGEDGGRLYDAPDGQPIAWLYPGAAYHVVESSDGWLHVSLVDGKSGWIRP
ncbi:hypothetical protein D6833_09580 [Candidatus Parcubacteria bacterium]|nr:MAG: hypothetical protein D6833_09580 [Candidatus Parcubacteria bacterium]